MKTSRSTLTIDLLRATLALRLAATQLIIAVTISLPLIQFYSGQYSWADGAMEIIGVTFNLPSLVLQLKVLLVSMSVFRAFTMSNR